MSREEKEYRATVAVEAWRLRDEEAPVLESKVVVVSLLPDVENDGAIVFFSSPGVL